MGAVLEVPVQQHVFVATDDAVGAWAFADILDLWPPLVPANNNSPSDTFPQISRTMVGLLGVRYRAYYLTFDTSSIGLNDTVLTAQLRIYVDSLAGSSGTLIQSGLSVANDFFLWGSSIDIAFADSIPPFSPGDPLQNDYSEVDPITAPLGLDGIIPPANIVLGQQLSFTCRPDFIQREGLTQYRVSMTGTAPPPSSTNTVRIRPLAAPAAFHSTLTVLLASKCVPLWSMA